MKFGDLFHSIRTRQQLSLADVADRSDLHRTTIWKMERGILPRGDSLRRAISLGLRLRETSKEFQQLVALWTETRTGTPIDADEQARETASVRRSAVADVAHLVAGIAALPEYLQRELRLVIKNPRALRMLKNINELSK